MIKNLILLLSIVTLLSCGGNDRKKEIETEKQNYASGISSSHKRLIKNILESDINLNKTKIPSKNSILVVEKNEEEILPYTNINSILKDRGYTISYDSNDLDYIIVVKFEWVKSGMYSGGRDAHDCRTLIYAIDAKTDKINFIDGVTIPAPEKVSERPRQDGYYGGIKYGGFKLADLVIKNVLN